MISSLSFLFEFNNSIIEDVPKKKKKNKSTFITYHVIYLCSVLLLELKLFSFVLDVVLVKYLYNL